MLSCGYHDNDADAARDRSSRSGYYPAALQLPFDESPITIFNKEDHMLEFHLGQAMESKLCG